MLCQSHIESWGDLPRSNGAPVPVTRPPLEQQGHGDDDGNAEEKPKTQGCGQDPGPPPAKPSCGAPVSPSPLKVSLETCHFRFYLQGL